MHTISSIWSATRIRSFSIKPMRPLELRLKGMKKKVEKNGVNYFSSEFNGRARAVWKAGGGCVSGKGIHADIPNLLPKIENFCTLSEDLEVPRAGSPPLDDSSPPKQHSYLVSITFYLTSLMVTFLRRSCCESIGEGKWPTTVWARVFELDDAR
jgi:hypothetical protein